PDASSRAAPPLGGFLTERPPSAGGPPLDSRGASLARRYAGAGPQPGCIRSRIAAGGAYRTARRARLGRPRRRTGRIAPCRGRPNQESHFLRALHLRHAAPLAMVRSFRLAQTSVG